MSEADDFIPTENDRAALARERFLTSHRAIAVCAREFGRLADEVVDRAVALCSELAIEVAPELRQTPDRCIVQIGPAALTMAWLRGPLDSLADGRLMVIAWQGTIARRRFTEAPLRKNTPLASRTAVSVWEESFVASADDESSWRWEYEADASRRYSSADLAARLIDQARSALQLRATA